MRFHNPYRYIVVPSERSVIDKERLAGYYRLSAYYLAKTVSEVPLILVQPAMYCTIFYWMAGFNYNVLVYLQILALVLLGALTAHVRDHKICNRQLCRCKYINKN